MNKKIFVIVGLLLLFSSSARAGGDSWRVKVQDQIAASEPVVLKLLILEKPRGIIAGCSMITIQVEYQRVPSWSWLPFISTSHPTQEETTKAIEFLNNKFKESNPTFFGYIGGGLFRVQLMAVPSKARAYDWSKAITMITMMAMLCFRFSILYRTGHFFNA